MNPHSVTKDQVGLGNVDNTSDANKPSNLTVKDDGTNKTTDADSINFVGSGVTATNSGDDVTVTISTGAGAGSNEWVFLSTPYSIWSQSGISGSAESGEIAVAGGSTGIPSCPRYIMFKGSTVQGKLSFWNAPGMMTFPTAPIDYNSTGEEGEWSGVWTAVDNYGFEFLFILPYIQTPIDYGDYASNSGGQDDLTEAGKVPDSTSHSNLVGLNKMKFRCDESWSGTATVNLHLLAYIA